MAATCSGFLHLWFPVRIAGTGENRIWCTCNPICWWICRYWHKPRQQGHVAWIPKVAAGKEPLERWSDYAPERRVIFFCLLCLHSQILSSDNYSFHWHGCLCCTRYIKEGSTVSVMGVVQRNDNVLMIVPPAEPISTGCQWAKCMLPTSLDGLVLRCEDTSDMDVIPV